MSTVNKNQCIDCDGDISTNVGIIMSDSSSPNNKIPYYECEKCGLLHTKEGRAEIIGRVAGTYLTSDGRPVYRGTRRTYEG